MAENISIAASFRDAPVFHPSDLHVCQKCLAADVTFAWQAKSDDFAYPTYDVERTPEHMWLSCLRCGYGWPELIEPLPSDTADV